MYSKILSQPNLDLVTLDEVKKQCRILNTFEDDYLTSLISVCSDLAQSYTRRMLSPGTAVVVVEEYYPIIQLPYGEVSTITEILLDGEVSTDFTFNPITQKVVIGTTFCEAQITFEAGYTVDNLPKSVKQGVLMMIGTLYNNREDFITGVTVEKLPMTSKILLNRVRYYAS